MSLTTTSNFPTWLYSVFGSLHQEVNHPGVFEALRGFHRRGARLMTTNYDELLEQYCGLQRVRCLIPEDVRKYEQRTLDGVFHIYGSFQDPQEVVLDPIGYYQVKTSDAVQNLLKSYLGHNTILFVGCGSGLEDPNFNALLEWASSREENIPNHHYLLARDEDSIRYNPLITLRYGPDYEDLVPYLNALLEDPANILTADTSAGRMTFAETGPAAQQVQRERCEVEASEIGTSESRPISKSIAASQGKNLETAIAKVLKSNVSRRILHHVSLRQLIRF
jgi:hypothetical protein